MPREGSFAKEPYSCRALSRYQNRVLLPKTQPGQISVFYVFFKTAQAYVCSYWGGALAVTFYTQEPGLCSAKEAGLCSAKEPNKGSFVACRAAVPWENFQIYYH